MRFQERTQALAVAYSFLKYLTVTNIDCEGSLLMTVHVRTRAFAIVMHSLWDLMGRVAWSWPFRFKPMPLHLAPLFSVWEVWDTTTMRVDCSWPSNFKRRPLRLPLHSLWNLLTSLARSLSPCLQIIAYMQTHSGQCGWPVASCVEASYHEVFGSSPSPPSV
jgi:hypothetical protein